MIYRNFITGTSPGVVLSDTVANVLTPFFTYTVPRGIGVVLPPKFPLVLKMMGGTDAAPIAIPGETKLYYGLKVPGDPDRVNPMGRRIVYRPWSELSLAQQQDDDFRGQLTVTLGDDFLPLAPEESFVLSVLGPAVVSGGTAGSLQVIEVPYVEKRLDELNELLALRFAARGV